MYLKAKELIGHLITLSGFPRLRPRSVQAGSPGVARLPSASSCAAAERGFPRPPSLQHGLSPQTSQPGSPSEASGALRSGPACKVSKRALASPRCCLTSRARCQPGSRKGTFQSQRRVSPGDGMSPHANEFWFPSLHKVEVFFAREADPLGCGWPRCCLGLAESLSLRLSVCPLAFPAAPLFPLREQSGVV